MKFLPVALVALMVMLSVPATQAATIFSDNFNGENSGVGVLNYTGFANWNVSGGAVDLIGNGFFDFFPNTGLFVDLDGSQFKSGLFSSKAIALTAGTYTLSFELAGSQRNSFETVFVTFGGLYSESFTFGTNDPFTLITRTINVGGPTSASIAFQNVGGDNIGLVLDNVSLSTPDTTPVETPEPASIALLALGLTGIGIFRRRAAR